MTVQLTGDPAHDAATILLDLADDCDRTQDKAFWILTSAACHLNFRALNNSDYNDGEPSTVATYFPERMKL